MRPFNSVLICVLTLFVGSLSQAALFEEQYLFSPEGRTHGHVHASCVVECPNGDLRAVWYENGTELPAPYFNKNKDKSDDVRIGGAVKKKGASEWGEPFVTADTFGVSDNNPCMVIDKQDRLWLVYPTLLGVPDWTWGSSLIRYRISSDYSMAGPPVWAKSDILVPHVKDLSPIVDKALDEAISSGRFPKEEIEKYRKEVEELFSQPLTTRLGWMPRAHPLVRKDGALLLPISNENFNVPVIAITQDGGETWTYSDPIPEAGLIQPTLVEYADGSIQAFFRNDSPKIRTSGSADGGITWSEVSEIDLPHPGSGLEALALTNGHLLMIYNDKTEGPRDRLAVSISEDRGKNWTFTRHLEDTPNGRFDYPSIVQGKDGTLHATYSYNLDTIKYVHFDEGWVREGDPK